MSKKSRSKTPCSSKKSSRLGAVAQARLVHWAMALALLPLLWAVLHQTGLMLPHLLREGVQSWWLYAAGIVSYLLLERMLAKPMWLYVFGHELTHVFSGVLSGASIHSFKAKSTGGEVRLSKSNAFIALSPYVLPLYAGIILLAYVITRRWWNPPQLFPVFQFVLGLALAFHISLTMSAIHRHQPDLKVLGFFLSGVLIVMGNVLIFGLLGISLFSKTPTWSAYSKGIWADTLAAWRQTIKISAKGTKITYAYLQTKPWTQ